MTSDVLRCTLAGLLKKLAGVKEMAISNGHSFDDHVHQSFWGSNAAGVSSTVLSLFIIAATFVVV